MSAVEGPVRYRLKIPYMWNNRKGFEDNLRYVKQTRKIDSCVIEYWPQCDNSDTVDNPVVIISLLSSQRQKGETIRGMVIRLLGWVVQTGERISDLEELSEALK